MLGASLSATVTVKEQVAVKPTASVTWKVLVVVPFGNELPLAKPAVCDVVAPTQLSVPAGVEYVTKVLQRPGEVCTLILLGQEIAGAILSVTVTVNEQEAVAPTASVTTKVLVVTPLGKEAPLAKPVD
jgi:hypothetical protein